MQPIDKVTGGVVDTYSALNSQRKYGADVAKPDRRGLTADRAMNLGKAY